MRVVVLTETYSKRMGYAQGALSKALARLGVEVHLLTPRLAPSHQRKDFQSIYGGFTGDELSTGTETERVDDYTVHYMPHCTRLGYVRMRGMRAKLQALRPNIVQTFVAISWLPLDAALLKPFLGYRLFTGSHTTASVFPLATKNAKTWSPARLTSLASRALPGRFISLFTERCYGATDDCADVAVRFFGVPRSKMTVAPLGVDTDVFFVDESEEARTRRNEVRAFAGASPEEILCIYTGRFTDEKNPLLLAQAVEKLRRAGEPYRALFVGNGPQMEAIAASDGCRVHPFIDFDQLGRFYRAAEIAVFPTQESMSMLDATACGLPLVVNDTMQALERVDGNGITYRLNDIDDLFRALRSLRDLNVRAALGRAGAERMKSQFSWEVLAKRRLADYRRALGSGRPSRQ